MEWLDGFRNHDAALALNREIDQLSSKVAKQCSRIAIMEVCGTHTVAISRHGIRTALPPLIDLISGPGCPVCVTDAGFIDAAVEISGRGAVIATFGDLIKVPGINGSLAEARAQGAAIEVCYSPAVALQIARQHPDREVVFLAVGFETTIAPLISILQQAIRANVRNFSLLTAFKLVPPALSILAADPEVKIDAFLCPAHVSAIIGARAYETVSKQFRLPCVIAGFEPLDILLAIVGILKQIMARQAIVDNQYSRVVKDEGNMIAQELIASYLETISVPWRGLGILKDSGLALRREYCDFDASHRFGVEVRSGGVDNGCRCGDVLRGIIKPPICPMFGKKCTPESPVGPCMVSSEGTCAAYYNYSGRKQ